MESKVSIPIDPMPKMFRKHTYIRKKQINKSTYAKNEIFATFFAQKLSKNKIEFLCKSRAVNVFLRIRTYDTYIKFSLDILFRNIFLEFQEGILNGKSFPPNT